MNKTSYAVFFFFSVIANVALLRHIGVLSGFWATVIPILLAVAIVLEESHTPKRKD